MALSESYLYAEDIHPIDVVETLAEAQDWDFDRIAEDQIAMVVQGQWRTYSITLAWSVQDETLRLISTFEMEPPRRRVPALLDLLNRINDQVWTGAFTYWSEHKMMVWRHGLILAGGQVPGEGHKYAKPKSRRLIAATLVDFLGRHGLVETPNLSLLDARIAEMKAGAPGVED